MNSHVRHCSNTLVFSVVVGKLMGGALGMALVDTTRWYAGVTPHLSPGPYPRGSGTPPRPTAPTQVHTRLILQYTEAQAPPWWLGWVLAVGGSLGLLCYSPRSSGEANIIAWELGMWSEPASEPTGAQRGRCGRVLRSHPVRPLRTDHHFRMVILAHLDRTPQHCHCRLP